MEEKGMLGYCKICKVSIRQDGIYFRAGEGLYYCQGCSMSLLNQGLSLKLDENVDYTKDVKQELLREMEEMLSKFMDKAKYVAILTALTGTSAIACYTHTSAMTISQLHKARHFMKGWDVVCKYAEKLARSKDCLVLIKSKPGAIADLSKYGGKMALDKCTHFTKVMKYSGYTMAIASAIEIGVNGYCLFTGQIGAKEFFRRTIKCVTRNAAIWGTGLGTAKICALIGTCTAPGVGTIIGGIGGFILGIILGVLAGYATEKIFEFFWPAEIDNKAVLAATALRYFRFTQKDFTSENKEKNYKQLKAFFNINAEKLLKEGKRDDEKAWLELATNYSIVCGIFQQCDKRRKVTMNTAFKELEKASKSLLN